MIAVPFKSVLWSVARKLGISPETQGIDLPIATQIVDGINTAIKLAWEYYDWPQIKFYSTYGVEAHPDGSGAKYLSNVDELGRQRFGALFGIYNADPRLMRAGRIPFTSLHDGYYLSKEVPEDIWVVYRPPYPEFSDAIYESRVYTFGEVVYLPADGQCYRCIELVTPGPTPPASPSAPEWAVVPFPKFLVEAVKFGAVASMNRTDGMGGSATVIENIMIEWLDHELDLIATQQRQQHKYQS